MFMNPLAVLRGGLAAAGTVLRVLASGPLAMLRVALYAISGLLGALLSPIGLVVTALAGVALVAVPPIYRIEAPTQIIIQTQPGQSAQDIAREVARQLDERERRLKAKARSNYSDQGGYDA